MDTTDKRHISALVEQMVLNDITTVVISPGSRNAPLTIAFESHPEINFYVIHDERVAAFFALGLAEGLGKAVALTCTSGSATLNYSPAIVEAYYRQIPLLVLTADRPAYLIDQGDGQCMRQDGIYQNFIKAAYKLPEASEESMVDQSIATVNSAIEKLLTVPQGPVHINIPLHEPLYQIAKKTEHHSLLRLNFDSNTVKNPISKALLEHYQQAEKVLIIVGQLTEADQLKPLLDAIVQQSAVAVLVENTSNLQNFYAYNHCIDRSLALIKPDEIELFRPDLLISIGGAIVSKKIKAFLRQNPPKHNWRIGIYTIDEDTFLSKTENIIVNPADVLKQLANTSGAISNYGQLWKAKDFEAMEKHSAFLQTAPFSDLLVTHFIIDTLPDHSILQMANSSVVRYCQLFNPISSIRYFANRGVSGIDGSTSTAVGMAVAKPDELVTLITGDISFFYDSNALWIENLPSNLRIFLINNNGGGIFNILEGSRKAKQNKLFVAPHKAKAQFICEAFDVMYFYADSMASLESNINEFYQFSDEGQPKLLEINTANCLNHEVLISYFEYIK
ncbi:MAG: 2-succinyl-5-enolpyruvyl-6-hydroxy-3-cyclohexene-1-carboxylic-acid synthase [Putridiphycobacter sp.]|nr:2-succinyl-5-enolpyruvyl-6-hydroxy-3-cyclohexene-1-carboxylic-acid synthase [Putridiphycobacter sp.]